MGQRGPVTGDWPQDGDRICSGDLANVFSRIGQKILGLIVVGPPHQQGQGWREDVGIGLDPLAELIAGHVDRGVHPSITSATYSKKLSSKGQQYFEHGVEVRVVGGFTGGWYGRGRRVVRRH